MIYRVIAVVGAGASGLMAAYAAAKAAKSAGIDARVLLLEGNQRPGKKLLATGNGRCNLTNQNISPAQYHGDTAKLHGILSRYPAQKIINIFKEIGLLCRQDSEGRVYPYNLQAAAVLKTLCGACEELGVVCRYDFPVFSVLKTPKGFVLKAENGEELLADKCIIACGGKASPKHSCGENGYAIAKQFRHSVSQLQPSLVQVKCADRRLKPMKGMRCKVKAALYYRGDKLYAESGEVIFSETALSGICVFNISSAITDVSRKNPHMQLEDMVIGLDLLEDIPSEKLRLHFKEMQKNRPQMLCGDILSGLVNIRVGEALLKSAGINRLQPVSALKNPDWDMLCALLKDCRFEVSGLSGFENAQITAGGIPLDEINENTMESFIQPGLYFCGEILDVNGGCGGYNLHFAWATGHMAGKSAGDNRIYV